MAKDVIVALDFPSAGIVFEFLDLFGDKKPFVKIGMELFYAEGPSIVKELKRRGHKVFLDLKLHDIPNTVKSAINVLKNLNADILNVHAGGGIAMMKSGLEGLAGKDDRPLLIAITQLTSTSEEVMHNELLIDRDIDMPTAVISYALNAKTAGLDGIVCSPMEAEFVHERCGKEFLTITPGVRFSDGDVGDQVRVTTPKMARKLGADYIVVGRPITRAENPVAAYNRCIEEFLSE